MQHDHLTYQKICVLIEKMEASFPIKKKKTYPCTKRTQFSLKLSWSYTVHKLYVFIMSRTSLRVNPHSTVA